MSLPGVSLHFYHFSQHCGKQKSQTWVAAPNRPLVRPRWLGPTLSHTTLARCHHSSHITHLHPPSLAPQSLPHLIVVLHEAADPLTLDLPFRLLKLLPPLLLLVLPVAVFFLPAIEAPHRVGSGSLTQRTNRFAHGGSCRDPRRRQTRDTALLKWSTENAKPACRDSAEGARARPETRPQAGRVGTH